MAISLIIVYDSKLIKPFPFYVRMLSFNGKTHKGYMTESGKGTYRITFDDTDQAMKIVIKGKNMMITNENDTIKLVFKTE